MVNAKILQFLYHILHVFTNNYYMLYAFSVSTKLAIQEEGVDGENH
jgi:hypothetical protein